MGDGQININLRRGPQLRNCFIAVRDMEKPIPNEGVFSGSILDKQGVAEEEPLSAWPWAPLAGPLAKLTFLIVEAADSFRDTKICISTNSPGQGFCCYPGTFRVWH